VGGRINIPMTETYGRRANDLMLNELTPEVIASLTDTQRTNLRMIQSISNINTTISNINTVLQEIKSEVATHEKILITGNGVPSLQERLRGLEKFVDTFQYWLRFVGGAIVLQTLAFFIGIVLALVRFLPLLEKLASNP
jgi:hypothetical protein